VGQKVALSSSDGRFDVIVSTEDVELIASMLILLEVPREAAARSMRTLYAVPDRSHAA
jgi:hypothetical protein